MLEWQKVTPVLVSIVLILTIAVARAYSRTLAAIVATMPVNIALALWIVSSAEQGSTPAMIEFTGSMVRGISATLVFVVTAWLAARAGWPFVPVLLVSYGVWIVVLGALFWLSGA